MNYGERLLEKIGVSSFKARENGMIGTCPVCEQEGAGRGADKLLISKDGKIHCYKLTGMPYEERQEHVKQILACYDINYREQVFEATHKLNYEGGWSFRFTLSQEPDKNGKHQVSVYRNKDKVYFGDLKLTSASDRTKVINSLKLCPQDASATMAALVQLCSKVYTYQEQQKQKVNRQDGFIQLSDGRLAEQTLSGFAVYCPVKKETEIRRSLEDAGTQYKLWQSGVSRGDSGGVLLPDNVVEFGTTAELFRELTAYVKTYVDLPEFEAQLSAAYILFTYLADKTWELPYLRITGESGSGKSRLTQVVGMACYRAMLVVSPTAASLYRTIEKFQPTLVIDEANMVSGSEDSEALFQILNAGYQRVNAIPRCERPNEDGEIEVKLFSAYSPKIITGLSTTDSRAFESRCIHIEMRRTSNLGISFQLNTALINDAARMRGMLTLWRLRHWKDDLDTDLVQAELELKKHDILPRFIQISIPLYAVMKEQALKDNFARLLVERSKAEKEDKKLTSEGVMVNIIWDKLFHEVNGTAYWRSLDLCEEGMPCELLSVEELTKEYNRRMAQDNARVMQSSVQVGRRLKQKLHLNSKTICKRSSQHYKASAVVFDSSRLDYLFNSYGLSLPERKVNGTESVPQQSDGWTL